VGGRFHRRGRDVPGFVNSAARPERDVTERAKLRAPSRSSRYPQRHHSPKPLIRPLHRGSSAPRRLFAAQSATVGALSGPAPRYSRDEIR